jgi:hypothetical protein
VYKVSFNTADEALAAPKANWAREKEPRGDAHRDNNVDTVPKHNDRVTRGSGEIASSQRVTGTSCLFSEARTRPILCIKFPQKWGV